MTVYDQAGPSVYFLVRAGLEVGQDLQRVAWLLQSQCPPFLIEFYHIGRSSKYITFHSKCLYMSQGY
jgi:hypothetical protein